MICIYNQTRLLAHGTQSILRCVMILLPDQPGVGTIGPFSAKQYGQNRFQVSRATGMQPATQPNVHLREAGAPKIRIYTFGTLHVIRDGMAVTEGDWHTRQARQLLKILLTERPRPVSTDLLIELLWPNSTPNAAATTLRSAINALRNVLEPDRPNRAPSRYIVTQAPGYAFHLTVDIWLDVEDFEHKLNLAHVSADPALRLALLESAIDLYKDDYLISDPYADWLQNERERLRERFFNALLQAAEFYAEGGHYADAITTCRRLLARDEVRENAYQSLMRYPGRVRRQRRGPAYL